MKITAVLVLVLSIHSFASSYGQTVKMNISSESTTFGEIIERLEKESGYYVVVKYDQTLLDKKYAIDFKDATVPEILDFLLKDTGLGYTIIENYIAISSITELRSSAQQQKTTTGRVVDQSGQSLPGVSVFVKGTTTGVVTEKDGNYRIVLPPDAKTLVYSFIGMKSREIEIGNQSKIDITLEEETFGIEEVVAVGYGTQKKVNLTGSIAVLKMDDKITSRSTPNLSSSLSGLIPGLTVQQSSGLAGKDNANLLIRGMGTINNASPLVVVDGMPDVDINRINMNDVESISVLKDAASASIYGSRAANGVILITTKSGSKDKTRFNYSGTFGLSEASNFYDFLVDYPRALTLHMRAADNGQNGQVFRQGTIDEWFAKGMVDPALYPNTNQWDVIFRQGQIKTHNLSASGGSDKMNFFISVGVTDQTGVMINNDYARKNFRSNLDYNLTSKLKVGFRMDGSWSNSNNFGVYSDIQYAIAGIIPQDPESGKYGAAMAYGEDSFAFNGLMTLSVIHNESERKEFNGNLYGEWLIINGLKARVDYGLRYYDQFNKSYNDPTDIWNLQTGLYSRTIFAASEGVSNSINDGYKTLLQGGLTYDLNLFNAHHLTVLAVATEEYWHDKNLSAARTDRIHPSLTEIDASLATQPTNGGNSSDEGLRSYIGRINYSIMDKYLFEANARYDGSSKFLPGYQYGFLPSASFGWRFTEEEFTHFLDNILASGKLRASYGTLGNNSGVGKYEQKDTYLLTNYILNEKIVKGFSANKIINQDFSWEKTTIKNLGLDLVFLGGKLTAEIDIYDRLTKGMIQSSQLSSLLSGDINSGMVNPRPNVSSGFTAPRVNIGELQNRGIEANFTWMSRYKTLNYGGNFNISYNQSKLLKWNEYLAKGNTFVNLPYHFVYTYEDNGIAQSWEDIQNAPYQNSRYTAPGDIVYKDLNGDGQFNAEDKKAIPVMNNDYFPLQGGLNLFAKWEGIDINILFQGAALRKVYWNDSFNKTSIPSARNNFQEFHWDDSWNLENRNATMPRLVTGSGGNNSQPSSYWLDNAAYLRLKNLMIGYNLPGNIIKKIGIQNLRLYFSAENLFTLTEYRGVDPEKSSGSDPFPLLKSTSFGINLDF